MMKILPNNLKRQHDLYANEYNSKAIEVLKDYRKNFQIFEKDGNSTHKKADCVVSLDEIQ